MEEVCIPAVAASAIAPADQVVLYQIGLDGTLAKRGEATKALALLLSRNNKAVKIGLFTNEPSRSGVATDTARRGPNWGALLPDGAMEGRNEDQETQEPLPSFPEQS